MTYLMAGSISNSSTSNNSISNNSVSNKMSVGAGHLFSALQRRDYRLIDCFHQPHPHLDGLYESGDEAIADAISWLQSIGSAALDASIGLEVSTASGDWRTIRQPELLLCPLPSKEEG
jgi:hypothetical protein